MPRVERARGHVRALAGAAFVLATGAAYFLVSTGAWDPVPISPPPPPMAEGPDGDQRLRQVGRAEQIEISSHRLPEGEATISSSVLWVAKAARLLPAREGSTISGFEVEEPRITILGEDDEPPTEIRAPKGRFTLASPEGSAPGSDARGAEGRLTGGVRLEQPGMALETDHLTLLLRPAPGSAPPPAGGAGGALQRLRGLDEDSVRIETDSPVRASLVRVEADGSRRYAGFQAEGGLKARADLKVLWLEGPVVARDSTGDLKIDADDSVQVELCPSQDFKGWLKEEVGDTLVVRSLRAKGNVFLHVRQAPTATQREVDLLVMGDRVSCDLSEGTLDITGSPGYLEERVSGRAIRARHIWARDLDRGREGMTEFHAEGEALFDAAIRRMRSELFPRRWEVTGDTISGLIRKKTSEKEKKRHPENPMPRLTIARSLVTSSPTRRGAFATHGAPRGDMHGSFATLTSEEGEEEELFVHALGDDQAPVEVLTSESRIVSRDAKLTTNPNESPNMFVTLEGDAVAHVGTDIVALTREPEAGKRAEDEVAAPAGPYDARGDRVGLELNPRPARGSVPWYERTALVRVRLEGQRARVDGKDGEGRPFSLEGTALDIDTGGAKVAAVSTGSSPAIARRGSMQVAAPELKGDLRSGEVTATGGVRAHGEREPGIDHAFSLDAARGSVTLEPDMRRRKELRTARAADQSAGILPIELPPEVLAFHAEGDDRSRVRLSDDEGTTLEADAVAWSSSAGVGVATSRPGAPRVLLRSDPHPGPHPPEEVLARSATIVTGRADAGAIPYRIELAEEVHAEGERLPDWLRGDTEPSPANGRFRLDSDYARADLVASSALGKRRIAWGPAVAWGERAPLVFSRTDGTEEGEVRARARVVRVCPDSAGLVLTGRPGEPVLVVGGADRIAAIEKDAKLLDPEKGREARRDIARESQEKPRKKRAAKSEDETSVPPFAVTAERLEGTAILHELERERARARTDEQRSEEERMRGLLRALRSVDGSGGVFLWVGDETVAGDRLDYSGLARRASVLGKPGKPVRVSGGGSEHETQRWTWKLDDPLPR